MNETAGIIKEIDNLGRIVLPKDYRDRLMLDKNVEVVLSPDGVLIRNPKYKLVEVQDDLAAKK